ncbi:hypothetical protein [Aeromonas sp. sif2416]|uniref:hypothetical protein n=1 Tax=Aeromonas sp. sif2416 TaxID=2854793 RepID=UPI001C47ECAB|nr:hypothetical protein [Aeromonas sp. sif2416]MBV7438793.1 hypothetical protein [Aeromonas sp. sif2416]
MVLNRVSDREITRGISVLVWGFEMPKAHAMNAGHFSGKAITCGIPMLVRGLNIHRSAP